MHAVTAASPSHQTLALSLPLALVLALAAGPAAALENGLARTPQMGWSSWNRFGCSGVSEAAVLGAARALVQTGLKGLGYECKLLLVRASDVRSVAHTRPVADTSGRATCVLSPSRRVGRRL